MIRPTKPPSFESMTRKDLLATARDRGLKGYSRLKKADLVDLLADAEGTPPRRIAVVAWEGDPLAPGGDSGAHVARLTGALSDAGADVHLFVRSDLEESLPGVTFPVHRIRTGAIGDVLAAATAFGAVTRDALLEEERRDGRFEVVHVHDWIGAEILRELPREGRQALLTLHSVEAVRSGGWGGELSSAIEDREREAVSAADSVLVLDERSRRHVIDAYGARAERVRRLDRPFPSERFAAALEDPGDIKARYAIGPLDPMTLYLGPLEEDHGPDLLLEAVPEALRFEPRARFVIVGDGTLVETLRRRATELGIEEAVRILGHLEGGEVEDLVRAADVMVVPSRSATSDGPVLCAWSAARPVIVTDEGPSAEIRDDENGLRASAEPASVAERLRRIFEDWDGARRLGERGRETLRRRHGWNAYADRLLEVYRA